MLTHIFSSIFRSGGLFVSWRISIHVTLVVTRGISTYEIGPAVLDIGLDK